MSRISNIAQVIVTMTISTAAWVIDVIVTAWVIESAFKFACDIVTGDDR